MSDQSGISYVDLSGVELCGEDLRARDLRGANLTNAKLDHTDLRAANLCSANLSGASLRHADLRGADLRVAIFRGANLRSANLSNTNAVYADFSGADLGRATVEAANLSHTYFNRHTNLNGTEFNGCSLAYSHLSGARFERVRFKNIDLTGADLNGADFANAFVAETKFADCDLSQANGLELVKHLGPSTVGVDTIYRSGGKIPDTFLKGCGVPESLIRYIPSLVGSEDGIQFYSCFISYSSKDEEFARRLSGKMRDAHLRVWFAPEDVQGGKKLHEQIETAIRVYDKLLIVLSIASLESDWVMTELRKARKQERVSGKRKLFPVRLVDFDRLRDWECFDADSGKDLAAELREYFIPDFSNWKDHDQFEASVKRLFADLRAETPAA